MRVTIRLKLLFGIGVPFLAITAATLALDHSRMRTAALQEAQVDLARIASREAVELDGFFQAAANVPLTIADAVAAGGIPSDDEIFQLLTGIVAGHPEYYGACFAVAPEALGPERARFAPYVCRDGDGLRSMDLSTGYDYTDPKWEWYDTPSRSGGPWWTEPYFDEGAGNAAMVTYSAPVRFEGRIVAISTVDVRLEDIQRRLVLPGGLEGAQWLILSRTGTFISVQQPELLLKSTVFEVARELESPEIDAMGRRMVGGERGSAQLNAVPGGGVERAARTTGPRLASFEPIPSTGWSFAMHVPESTILGPVYAELQDRLTAIALMSLALLAVLLGVAFWISRPIPRLAAAVRELSAGKLDARVTNVNTTDEFGELASGFNHMVEELNRHVARLTDETASRERVESELRVAREIQLSLLPGTFPPFPDRPEFDLHAVNVAARRIAGDFFDFEMIDGERLFFTIADVSGKGVPAAMFMAVTRTLLRNLNRTTESPAQIVETINRVLLPENRKMMFVTLIAGFYDIRSGKISFVNAGHPPGYLLGGGGVRASCAESGSLLGVVQGETWQDGVEILGPGEILVLFTDGVTEAGMGEGPMYGAARLEALLRETPRASARGVAEAILADIQRFRPGPLTDDLTLLVLKRNG